jgi:hypothetical protein
VRIKNGKGVGVSVFLTSIALSEFVIPAIISIGVVVSITYYIIAASVSASIGLLAAYLRGRMKLIPDSLIDDLSSDGQYSCEFCSSDKLREACDMTKPYYGNEYVPAEVAEQWRMKDSRAFVQITNSNGQLCACFGILALSDSFMDQYVRGNVADTQLNEVDILSFEQSKKSKRLYISGVVVRDPSKHVGRKRACVMIWAMMVYVKRVFGLRKERELFAVAVTSESEKLMKNLGFHIVSNAAQRRDKRNMYRLTLSKTTWDKLMLNVSDYSRMCKFDLHFEAQK